jgi:hypothetical protein
LNSNKNTVLPSERSFGLLFASVCGGLAVYGYFLGGWDRLFVFALAICAVAFGFLAFVFSKVLRPLNWLWYQLGQLLGKVVSPIVLGSIFFLLLTPVSLVTRMFGRDELRLTKSKGQQSYWIERSPPGPEPTSFKNQF